MFVNIQDLDIASSTDTRSQTDVILLDFSNAFDKVSHERLLSNMEHYGIRGNMHKWIRDFLQECHQVILDGKLSRTAAVQSDVLHGGGVVESSPIHQTVIMTWIINLHRRNKGDMQT